VRLAVCALADLDAEVERLSPAGVVSLLGPGQPAPEVRTDAARLLLWFNDIGGPTPGFVAPTREMVADLLAFADALPTAGVLLIHCWMGISRSPAAAYILACAQAPERSEDWIAQVLRKAAPSATPNPLLVALADEALGREGRMRAAVARIGRGCDAATGLPFELDVGATP
jgi:predicted protein tyrosine phosphatase